MSDTGSNDELLVDDRQGREAKTSSGGRQVGESSGWTVTLRLGELGGEKQAKRKRKAASTEERWRIDRIQVRGRKIEIQKRFKQLGQEEYRIVIKIAMEPRYGAVPI